MPDLAERLDVAWVFGPALGERDDVVANGGGRVPAVGLTDPAQGLTSEEVCSQSLERSTTDTPW